jgi:hypothetical protein
MHDERQRFSEVLDTLEQERQRVDEDLRRLVVAAAYLRAMLPERRREDDVALLGAHGNAIRRRQKT